MILYHTDICISMNQKSLILGWVLLAALNLNYLRRWGKSLHYLHFIWDNFKLSTGKSFFNCFTTSAWNMLLPPSCWYCCKACIPLETSVYQSCVLESSGSFPFCWLFVVVTANIFSVLLLCFGERLAPHTSHGHMNNCTLFSKALIWREFCENT